MSHRRNMGIFLSNAILAEISEEQNRRKERQKKEQQEKIRKALEKKERQERLRREAEEKARKEAERKRLEEIERARREEEARKKRVCALSEQLAEIKKLYDKLTGVDSNNFVSNDEKEISDLEREALLHDIGKIGIPDAVLNKPGRLTDEEYAIMKSHVVRGAEILKDFTLVEHVVDGTRFHHERYDGKGYPDGIKGTDISEEARIIAVADAYDAMSSHRSYREPLPQEAVRAEIEKGKGTQFDPGFASIMLEMIDEDTDYTMREK